MSAIARGLERLNKNLEKLIETKISETPVEVWLIRYDHRHGTDIWAEATEETAWASVANQVRESLNEICDEAKETLIERLLVSKDPKDVKEAFRIYCEASEEEFEVWKHVIGAR